MLLCSGVYIHGRKGGIKNNCQVRDFAPATRPYNLILGTLWQLVPVGSSEHPQFWKAETCGLVCRALRDAMTRAVNLHSSVGAAMGLKSSHEHGDPAAQGTYCSGLALCGTLSLSMALFCVHLPRWVVCSMRGQDYLSCSQSPYQTHSKYSKMKGSGVEGREELTCLGR